MYNEESHNFFEKLDQKACMTEKEVKAFMEAATDDDINDFFNSCEVMIVSRGAGNGQRHGEFEKFYYV